MDPIKSHTDLGNVARFITQHKNDLQYCPQLRQWLCWSGERWKFDGAGLVSQQAKQRTKTIEQEADLSKKTFGHFLKQRGIEQKKNDGIRYWVGLVMKTINARSYDSTVSRLETCQSVH